jgi:hypothetical protein
MYFKHRWELCRHRVVVVVVVVGGGGGVAVGAVVPLFFKLKVGPSGPFQLHKILTLPFHSSSSQVSSSCSAYTKYVNKNTQYFVIVHFLAYKSHHRHGVTSDNT